MRHENSSILELDGKEVSEFTPSKPREKWLRKRTHVKIRVGVLSTQPLETVWGVSLVDIVFFLDWQNVTANHRTSDAVFTEDSQQVVTGRFMYGPLDMVTLAGEKVNVSQSKPHTHNCYFCYFCWVFDARLQIDLHIMTQPPSGEWLYFNTEVTNSTGRVSFVIPEDKRLGIGVYPVKMVVRWDFLFRLFSVFLPVWMQSFQCGVSISYQLLLKLLISWPFSRGDHTFADSYLTVVPRGTEFVVFSIDGSFAASVSIMGSDPKVRAGAVDVVRYQDLLSCDCCGGMIWMMCSPVCFIALLSPFQALAGFRLSDHLRDRTTGHAEATGGGLVVAAQFPSRHRLVLRRPGPWPSETQGQLPQVPNRGQTMREGQNPMRYPMPCCNLNQCRVKKEERIYIHTININPNATDSRLTWRFSLATDQPKIYQSTPRLVSLQPKYTSLEDPQKRCSTSARYRLTHDFKGKVFVTNNNNWIITNNDILFCLPKVHHRRICSSFVTARVQSPISPGQVQQRTHGVAQKQLRSGRKRRLPEEEEPPVAHHLLTTGPDFADRRHPQQAGTHAEPIRRGAAGVYSQPQPGSSTAQHEHHSQLLGPQQQHQAGAGDL